MPTPTRFASAAVALACCLAPAAARAQVPTPYRPQTQPAVSPYLNLLRRGTPPA